jgi:putative membrane protein
VRRWSFLNTAAAMALVVVPAISGRAAAQSPQGAGSAVAAPYAGYGHMMGYGYGAQSVGWMMVHGVFWLILLGFVILLVLRVGKPAGREGPAGRSPGLDILQERYARGDINRTEYLQKKHDLLGHGGA